MKINIKPLSVNDCWRGQRFKTPEYKKYENDLLFLLPKIILPDAPYEIFLKFHFSSRGSDLDNPVKPILDVLQKRYFFNDKMVYKMTIEKAIVEKGKEHFEFMILPYEPTAINRRDE